MEKLNLALWEEEEERQVRVGGCVWVGGVSCRGVPVGRAPRKVEAALHRAIPRAHVRVAVRVK